MLKKLWQEVVEFSKKTWFSIDDVFSQIDDFYKRFHAIIKIIFISAIIFSAVNYLNNSRNFFKNQEIFDLNEVPSGYVAWVYPKDKTQSAAMPDSLKKSLNIQTNHLNYNVDVWIVAIYTHQHQIIKIEVPDYAIDHFQLGEFFVSPSDAEKHIKD